MSWSDFLELAGAILTLLLCVAYLLGYLAFTGMIVYIVWKAFLFVLAGGLG